MQSGGKKKAEIADSVRTFGSFAEFWPFYVSQHSHPQTRLLHFCGSTASLTLVLIGVLTATPWFILAAFVVGYTFAWYSHFFIEKNRPATFGHPFWSFRADFKMWFLMFTGRMNAEVGRVLSNDASDLK